MYVFTVYFKGLMESRRNEYANFANPEQRQEAYHAIRIVYKCHYPNNKFHFLVNHYVNLTQSNHVHLSNEQLNHIPTSPQTTSSSATSTSITYKSSAMAAYVPMRLN